MEGQELVVEFDENLEPDQISVVNPDGEGYAETSVSAGVTQVSFEISMPYPPGEYTIIATQDGDEVAEVKQEIAPELEIRDVGVGSNRMDEMPEELGNTKEEEALVKVENTGSGPEYVDRLRFEGFLPNDRERSDSRTGIFVPEQGREASSPVAIWNDDTRTLYTSLLPFSFEGNGVKCKEEAQTGEFKVRIHGSVRGPYEKEYDIEYSSSESYDGCDISISAQE